MSSSNPSVVYRTRNFPSANALLAFLRDAGLNAHLVNPSNQHGQYSQAGDGPVFGWIYEVYVVGSADEEIESLLDDWRQMQDSISESNEPFCYYCGEGLSTYTGICPRCGRSLDPPEA